jgi:hypothetical protein
MNEITMKIEKQKSKFINNLGISKGNLILNSILIFSFSIPLTYLGLNIQKLLSIDHALITILLSILTSFVAFGTTYYMIPYFMELNKSKKIFGVDINKVNDIKDLKDPNRVEV